MSSITAFVVMLTLTGTPILNVACVVWCAERAMAGDCDDEMGQSASTRVADPATTCALLAADSLFIREDARVLLDTSAPQWSFAIGNSPILAAARLAYVHGSSDSVFGRPVPALVLRA